MNPGEPRQLQLLAVALDAVESMGATLVRVRQLTADSAIPLDLTVVHALMAELESLVVGATAAAVRSRREQS